MTSRPVSLLLFGEVVNLPTAICDFCLRAAAAKIRLARDLPSLTYGKRQGPLRHRHGSLGFYASGFALGFVSLDILHFYMICLHRYITW